MKSVKKYYSIFVILALFAFANGQTTVSQSAALSPQDKKIIEEFELRAEAYSKLRESVEKKLPKLSKDATPEQIQAHKASFQKSVQQKRRGFRQGDIFTPAAAQLIRTIIKNEFKGKERVELRQTVLEGDTKGVPLKINYPYPETKELIEMTPTLLLALPQLPKQLRFRFVGSNLLLVDRENGLIVDYMTKALP
jgi:hypothetical protein